MSKFKVSNKVKIPTIKNYGCSLEESSAIQAANENNIPFLYITEINDDIYTCWYKEGVNGDFFLESDLELYEEEEVKIPEKWFIKITEENQELLSKYRETLPNVNNSYQFLGCLGNIPRHDSSYLDYCAEGAGFKILGAEEISFEFFKEYLTGILEVPFEEDITKAVTSANKIIEKKAVSDNVEYSMRNNHNVLQHTIIKYVDRYKFENGLQDLHRAKQYIEMLIEWEEKELAASSRFNS